MRKHIRLEVCFLKMEPKLQLYICFLLIQGSLAEWQRITVMKGETVELRCPVTKVHQTSVEWKNPEGYVMFFQESKVTPGVKEKRYSIGVSKSEFVVSISDVNFKDGGNYTCSQYHNDPLEKKVEVTVLGHPTITKTMDKGTYDIKCKAEANHYAPQIFWKIDNGPEIRAHSQIHHMDRQYSSKARLSLSSVENSVTVKCLVRHPALYSNVLMDFIKIRQKYPLTVTATKPQWTRTTSPPTAKTPWRTQAQRTTGWLRPTRTDVTGPLSEYSKTTSSPSNRPDVLTASTSSPLKTLTVTGSSLSARGWTPETIEKTTLNQTEGNRTGIFNDKEDMKKQTGDEGNQSLLVFLVTCLIVGLLVVVIFFGIKLRRAHIIWKRENEDSDPSEESSKSKSSQEEKNSHGQKRRGIFNTAFTQYVAEKPPRITSVVNTAAMAAVENTTTEQTAQPQTPIQTSAKCDIKETEL